VYDSKEYDAAAVDIWSLAIIFCCMTLRRFPWKIPKMTDNSFKLFAAEPTPGHDPNKLVVRAKSESDLSHTRAREFLTGEEGKEKEKEKLPHSQRHQQQQQSEPKEEGTSGSAKTSADKPSTDRPAGDKKETIRGPWRILRLLPRESRHIIHRMLDLNPKTRATMEDILAEAWVADTVICQQFDDGTVVPAEDHTHVLEPHSSQAQQKA
jgi:serine/threonine protein kinase